MGFLKPNTPAAPAPPPPPPNPATPADASSQVAGLQAQQTAAALAGAGFGNTVRSSSQGASPAATGKQTLGA
jgi:hypothetical protein